MNVMTVDGYHAEIGYDEELDLFRGDILGLSGGADFYGKNPKELQASSNCASLPSCMNGWPSKHGRKARASTRVAS